MSKKKTYYSSCSKKPIQNIPSTSPPTTKKKCATSSFYASVTSCKNLEIYHASIYARCWAFFPQAISKEIFLPEKYLSNFQPLCCCNFINKK